MKRIYLDNAATTIVDKEVVKAMLPYFRVQYGNPSSQHYFGEQAKAALDDSRKIVAESIGASKEEIIFTGSGTESNNLAIKGLFFANPGKKHIITTKIEHPSILSPCSSLEKNFGAKVTYLGVDKFGRIDTRELEKAMTAETLVVSVIQGNNEIGTLQDIEAIGKICKQKKVYFHIDACQSYMKTDLDVNKHNLDFVTLNAHKIHGPKGVGALFIRKGSKILPLLDGGGHEFGMRSSTENVAEIVGFAKAVSIFKKSDVDKIEKLRDHLINGIFKIPATRLNGPDKNRRLCNNISICFGNIEGEAIAAHLNNAGVAVSTGSACSSNSLKSSHVLREIGLSHLEANSTIRISLSKYNTRQELDNFLKELAKIVKKLREMSPIVLDDK